MNTKKQRKAGFTLVELMVVAIIVAILAAVAIPLMNGNKKRAMGTEAEAAMGTIATALRLYLLEHGSYPNVGRKAASTLAGIGDSDLDGQYFDTTNYDYLSGKNFYLIICIGRSESGRGKNEGATSGMITVFNNGKFKRNY